jgi:VWFA-related protein
MDDLAKLPDAPALVIYDSSGAQISILDRRLHWNGVMEELLRFRGERPRIIRATELRLAGQVPEADLLLGTALLNSREVRAAAYWLDRAMKGFRAANNEELAQLAQVLGGSAIYVGGNPARGRKMIDDVLINPASDAVAAEAYINIAGQHEADSQRRTVTVDNRGTPTLRMLALASQRSRAWAIESYRKAYELAAPGSIALRQATYALSRLDDQPLPLRKGALKSSLRIVPPARTTIIGDADFSVESDGDFARVDYFLDDVKAQSSTKAPFRVTIDIGRVPRVRTVKAVAFDPLGNAKGEAVLTINDRADAFMVSIVKPAAASIAGANDVELDMRIPSGRSLTNVELSWNGKEVATLTKAPFRARIDVTAGEFGYLRALATLDDGTATEATKIYNASGVSESVEVGAVTVIASVTDKNGDNVTGLNASDFSIEDEGKSVTPMLRSTDDDPVTIGLAIDSSSSMSGRQLYIIRAATQFLARALRPQDRAFIVAFDSGARMVHPRSGDAASLTEAVYDLTPNGGTSIFDGVTFSLQQFQGIGGKKALLVFSDGREGTSSASAQECERLARTVGVPVYVVVPPALRGTPNALTYISKFTGGLMFLGEPEETFPALFDRLAAAMRGQYVLSFTRPAGIKSGTWRSIRVGVPRRDTKVRTIEGYRAN